MKQLANDQNFFKRKNVPKHWPVISYKTDTYLS